MRDPERTRLAVLGSPIAHSLSPTIHAAAYRVLDTGWSYDAHDVTGDSLTSFVTSLDEHWRGLSLTMPLKRDILPLLTARDEMVDRVGAANTVLLGDSVVSGFNTDVRGAVESFRRSGVTALDSVHILGAGATAASLLVAAVELGTTRVLVSARSVERADPLRALGSREGIDVVVRPWGTTDRSLIVPDAVISTIPHGAVDLDFSEEVRRTATLFDVAYDPWPTPLALQWSDAGGRVISGLDLLINQAVGQIRVFLTGDLEQPLPEEESVIAAMWESVKSRH